MTRPLVSVLIPCHNAAAYVGAAVESALAQTHPRVEVVVVDDGSADGSPDVVRGFGGRVVLEAGPNRGACAARNRALALSTGEYVQFLDADDLLHPDKVARQLPYLERGEADLVLCGVERFGEYDPAGPDRWPTPPPPAPGQDPFLYLLRHRAQTAAPLHRRSFVERAGGFREGLARQQETDFHLRLAALGPRLAVVPEPLVRFREHHGPRISSRPVSLTNKIAVYTLVAEYLTSNRLSTPEREAELGKLLVWLIRVQMATPPYDRCRRALKAVRALYPAGLRDDHRLFRGVRAVLGDQAAERLRAFVYRVYGARRDRAGASSRTDAV